MLYNHFTEELIELQDLIIEKIESDEKEIHIYGKLERKIHKCPNCGDETDRIHDYREQEIKDIPVYGKKAFIHLQKRQRYESDSAYGCGIDRFIKCSQTMTNWLTGILNSFSTPVTNGFTEGCNNKIKVLKRIAYGYQNFHRFRNRILHIFSFRSA